MRTPRKSESRHERYDYTLSGVKKSEPLTIMQIKFIFLIALDDYLGGHLSEKPFEDISGDLYYHFSKSPNHIQENDPELSAMLDCASDLTYYTKRAGKSTSTKERCIDMIDELKTYFKNNKDLIETKGKSRLDQSKA